MVLSRALFPALVAVAVAGCIHAPVFHCETDENCGAGNRCKLDKCVVAADHCESGWAFDESAGSFGGTCFACEPSPSKPTSLVTGSHHACVVTDANELYCWGRNDTSQLGRPGAPTRPGRVRATALEDVWVEVSAGENHTCARGDENDVYCWGNNDRGATGLPNTDGITPEPTLIVESGGVDGLEAGNHHTCILSGAAARCWGDNSQGQLHRVTEAGWANLPAMMDQAEQIAALSAGTDHTCIVRPTTPTVAECFGEPVWSPPAVGTPPANLTKLAAGHDGVCVLAEGGRVACSGIPQPRTDIRASAVTTGAGFACAITNDDSVECWGRDPFDGVVTSAAISVSAGHDFACVLQADGSVWCWGANDVGQLGIGAVGPRAAPEQIPDFCR